MAILPMVPMALVFAVTLVAILQKSNMWPVGLIVTGPLAVLFLVLVLLLHRVMRHRIGLIR